MRDKGWRRDGEKEERNWTKCGEGRKKGKRKGSKGPATF